MINSIKDILKTEKYFIYTDASFSKNDSFGVSGFMVFFQDENHNKSLIDERGIRLKSFQESNNIRSELLGAIYALEMFKLEMESKNLNIKTLDVHLYSDCQTLTNLLKRREKLEAHNFISGRKKSLLANADLYQYFFALYDKMNPTIHWVKGHSKNDNQTLFQKNFQIIDRAVRKELRLRLK